MSARGSKLSEEHKAKIKAGVLAAKANGANVGGKGTKKPGSGGKKGHSVSEETRRKISDTLTGQPFTPERCANIAAAFTPERRATLAKNKFDGGMLANAFAQVLCPIGFVREHAIWIGHKQNSKGQKQGRYRMDFAHVEGKIDIELDDPRHDTTAHARWDFERDAVLRSLGWKVIRIKV